MHAGRRQMMVAQVQGLLLQEQEEALERARAPAQEQEEALERARAPARAALSTECEVEPDARGGSRVGAEGGVGAGAGVAADAQAVREPARDGAGAISAAGVADKERRGADLAARRGADVDSTPRPQPRRAAVRSVRPPPVCERCLPPLPAPYPDRGDEKTIGRLQ